MGTALTTDYELELLGRLVSELLSRASLVMLVKEPPLESGSAGGWQATLCAPDGERWHAEGPDAAEVLMDCLRDGETKLCSRCRESRPVYRFSPGDRWCNGCRAYLARQHRARKRERFHGAEADLEEQVAAQEHQREQLKLGCRRYRERKRAEREAGVAEAPAPDAPAVPTALSLRSLRGWQTRRARRDAATAPAPDACQCSVSASGPPQPVEAGVGSVEAEL